MSVLELRCSAIWVTQAAAFDICARDSLAAASACASACCAAGLAPWLRAMPLRVAWEMVRRVEPCGESSRCR